MTHQPDKSRQEQLRERITELDAERNHLQGELRALDTERVLQNPAGDSSLTINTRSPSAEKVALFRRLFAGRVDVFPVRWQNAKAGRSGYAPACFNEWRPLICRKPEIRCSACAHQAFIPVSSDVVRRHLGAKRENLNSDFVAGVYPLLASNTCHFVAIDFDGAHWAEDATACMETCQQLNVPAALERSRSGDGGHVWIFFAEAVPAKTARQLGTHVLSETMERRPEIGFTSYDRLFPSQDVMPLGGFGNLIALPLQSRARQQGNSVFVDAQLQPYHDQWAFLSSIVPMARAAVNAIVDSAEVTGRVTRIRTAVDDEYASQPWLALPSRQPPEIKLAAVLTHTIDIVLADGVYVDRRQLPSAVVAQLMRLAAFHNPEFFRAQAMRLSTLGKPRIISCAELHQDHVELPRGCLDEAVALLQRLGARTNILDKREPGTPLDTKFLGTLQGEQILAASAILAHPFGVLAAATAFGKTVVAASVIAARGCSTLVLVHRRELMAQWVERLAAFLSIDRSDIGTIGGGVRKPSGKIDVAVIQSVVRKGVVSDEIGGYGHLVVDECHHLSAASFELVARRSKARYVLGLSATIARRDGHERIILMQCGPVRYRVHDKAQASLRSFAHQVRMRETALQLPESVDGSVIHITEIYRLLAGDSVRNTLIVDDVASAIAEGRSPLVLTERREHLEALHQELKTLDADVVVLRGAMKLSERNQAYAALRADTARPRIVLSTGRYLGEGFDHAQLDTLLLTAPVAWKGTLAQYVGRLHREHQGKKSVVVYDYVDRQIPVLARMSAKREAGYRALGYSFVR